MSSPSEPASEPASKPNPVETIEDMLRMFPVVLAGLVLSFGYVDHKAETEKRKITLNASISTNTWWNYIGSKYCKDCGQFRDVIYDGSQFRVACQGFGSFGRHRPCREVKYTICDCINCSACKWGVCNKKHRWCEHCNSVKSILDR